MGEVDLERQPPTSTRHPDGAWVDLKPDRKMLGIAGLFVGFVAVLAVFLVIGLVLT